MAEISKVKSVKVWTTSDGRTFDNQALAALHQSVLNLRAWFLATVDEATTVQLVDAIIADVDGFREIVHPILLKPRAPRGSKKASEPAVETIADQAPTPIASAKRGVA